MNAPASPAAAMGEKTTPTDDDSALLRRYAEDGSEAAFTELVERHVNLVYGAALRRAGDPHRAADITQLVFTALARKAHALVGHGALGGWLHTATRNAALNLMISEKRRLDRERASVIDPAFAGIETPCDWDRVRPVLDQAIDELAGPDRLAIVLRFLERRSFNEIGSALRVSEDAARMRTERALDKLREILGQRGITSTGAALGATLTSQAFTAAPAGLVRTLVATAIAGGGAVSLGSLLSLIMNTKLVATGVVSAVVFFTAGLYFGLDYTVSQPLPPPAEIPQQSRMIASFRAENGRLRAEVDRLNAAAKAAAARPAPAPRLTPQAEQPAARPDLASVQRAILNNLRQLSAARDQFILENGRPPTSLDELVGDTKYIRRLNPVSGESYAMLPLVRGVPLTVVTPDGVTVTYDQSGQNTTKPQLSPEEMQIQATMERIKPAIDRAVAAYEAANNGARPPNPQALVSYFSTPQEGADFVEAMDVVNALRAKPPGR